MFDKLEKHHLGFIVPLEERDRIQKRFSKEFHYDETQRTHVLFVFDENLRIYLEFICQEGRVAKQPPGFAHICYSLKDGRQVEELEQFIKENKIGYPLTKWEKSGSQECGWIKFYFIKNQGVVELNSLQGKPNV